MSAYVEAAVELRGRGLALPFATLRRSDGAVVGSTRFFEFDRWPWPEGHPRRGGPVDGVEIGYTWLSGSAVRTAINTEAKLLMLTHAFDTWRAVRVCASTDARNDRSAAAMERLGAKFEAFCARTGSRWIRSRDLTVFDRRGRMACGEGTLGARLTAG